MGKLRKADIGVSLYVLAAFVMLIVPIPSGLLDVLLACNISIGFVIMFSCMFANEVLNLSFYPTVLLFTTVFRVALNVSSTKLILSTGDPGNVVRTFGEYVGGGDLVIGIIVFIILIIVQFMIINKGTERVAEVTARFTLDAMPGKQMAIDADLNTGAITDAEAKKRRDKIQEESSFFGSMDGAVKYVKGDATAGLVITAVNIIGGIAMGVVRQGMPFAEALDKYTILTIGDGLVSQIPSLLTSLATGILVTKGSKDADFGTVLIRQFFGVPRVLYLVGAVIAVLGIITPLNTLIFVVLVYLLSKIVIEKNAQSISMAKILGYSDGEIARLYLLPTSLVVVACLLISLPVESKVMEWLFYTIMLESISGWIPLYVEPNLYVKMLAIGLTAYAAVAVLELRRIRRVPMDEALKNVE